MHQALAGDDVVILPYSTTVANEIAYDITITFEHAAATIDSYQGGETAPPKYPGINSSMVPGHMVTFTSDPKTIGRAKPTSWASTREKRRENRAMRHQ